MMPRTVTREEALEAAQRLRRAAALIEATARRVRACDDPAWAQALIEARGMVRRCLDLDAGEPKRSP